MNRNNEFAVCKNESAQRVSERTHFDVFNLNLFNEHENGCVYNGFQPCDSANIKLLDCCSSGFGVTYFFVSVCVLRFIDNKPFYPLFIIANCKPLNSIPIFCALSLIHLEIQSRKKDHANLLWFNLSPYSVRFTVWPDTRLHTYT